jgi:hypothetical protein
MLTKIKKAWRWSKASGLYLDREYDDFLKAIQDLEQDFELNSFQKTVVANAKIMVGKRNEAKSDFKNLIETSNSEYEYLKHYWDASIAHLNQDQNLYNIARYKANKYSTARFKRFLPI